MMDIVAWFLDYTGATMRHQGENWIIERGKTVTTHPGGPVDAVTYALQCALETENRCARCSHCRADGQPT